MKTLNVLKYELKIMDKFRNVKYDCSLVIFLQQLLAPDEL